MRKGREGGRGGREEEGEERGRGEEYIRTPLVISHSYIIILAQIYVQMYIL